MNRSNLHKTLLKICFAAMMTAIVFVGNFLRITMPVPLGGVTGVRLSPGGAPGAEMPGRYGC